MKKMIALAVLLLLVSTAGFAAQKEFKGYLSDTLCGVSGKDNAGNDLTMYPEKHTLDWMMQDTCVAAGYGIFIKDKDNKYTFHKFDKAGSVMAKEKVLDESVRKDHIAIVVEGQMQKDGSIKVRNIRSAEVDELYKPSEKGYKSTDQ